MFLWPAQKSDDYINHLPLEKISMQKNKQEKALYKEIAGSIASIVRYSLNEEFRESCYKALNVDSTPKLEKAMCERLESVVNKVPLPPLDKPGQNEMKACNLEEKENHKPSQEQPPPENVTPRKPITFLPNQSRSWLKVAAEQSQRSAQKRRLEDNPSTASGLERRSLTPSINNWRLHKNATDSSAHKNRPSSAPPLRYFPLHESSPRPIQFSLHMVNSERDESIEAVRKILFFDED